MDLFWETGGVLENVCFTIVKPCFGRFWKAPETSDSEAFTTSASGAVLSRKLAHLDASWGAQSSPEEPVESAPRPPF